jgi:long-chain acyl-CoA synthetase
LSQPGARRRDALAARQGESEVNVTSVLRRTVQIRSRGIATVCNERTRTWAEFLERVERLAGGLSGIGLARGERLATLMQNSDRYFECLFATAWCGCTAVPLNIRWNAAELAHAIRDSGVRMLIIDDATRELGLDLVRRREGALQLVHAGEQDVGGADGLSYEELLGRGERIPAADPAPDDVFAIFYTGGTTGRSKGVMVTHANIIASTTASLAEGLFAEDTVYLNCMPTFHLSSAWPIVATAMTGAKSIIQAAVQPRAMLEAIERERITEIFLVPTTIQMLIEEPEFAQRDTRSLRRIIYGASPITEALLDRAIAAFPQTQFIQVYGMTELSPLGTVLHSCHLVGEGRRRGRHRSAGRAVYGVEIEILDPAGRPAPRGTVGEIAIRGSNVMRGYWNRPEETATALREGWMHSGDGAWMDEDGFLYIADRIKDMIISGGENIYSVEVENVIGQHAAVQQCVVIGVPDEKWGERVHAFVIARPGSNVTEQDIIAHCQERIAHYKCPRSVEFRTEPFPLSPVGKILKHELRRQLTERTRV